MIFDDLKTGDAVFVDANTLMYHFTNHPKYGAACTRFLERIEVVDAAAHAQAVRPVAVAQPAGSLVVAGVRAGALELPGATG
jgi:hypothetical protein